MPLGDLPICFDCGRYIYSSGGCSCKAHQVITYGPPKTPHKCPVCDGTGKVSRPPWVAGDVDSWTDSQTGPYECKPCNGEGIVWS